MQGMGNIYKCSKEIKARKAEIKRREKNKKTPKEVKDGLLKFLRRKNN